MRVNEMGVLRVAFMRFRRAGDKIEYKRATYYKEITCTEHYNEYMSRRVLLRSIQVFQSSRVQIVT